MQNTRTIKWGAITGGNGANGTTYSNASTYAELQNQEAQIAALSNSGMKALVQDGANKYQLVDGNSQLPSGDFSLYFTNDKNSSGND